VFHSILVETSVLRPIRPHFLSEAILLIVFPISLIMCAVYLRQLSLSVNFVVGPFAYVDESILWINKVPAFLSFTILKVAFILTAIRPNLLSFTIEYVSSFQEVSCAKRIVTFKFYVFLVLVVFVVFKSVVILTHLEFLDYTLVNHFVYELVHELTFVAAYES